MGRVRVKFRVVVGVGLARISGMPQPRILAVSYRRSNSRLRSNVDSENFCITFAQSHLVPLQSSYPGCCLGLTLFLFARCCCCCCYCRHCWCG